MSREGGNTGDGGGASAAHALADANPQGCLQCRKCTCGCPVAAHMDLRPHELVRLVQLDETDEALRSKMLWACTSCQTCVTRCPQKVDIPALVDALRRLARAAGKTDAATTVPAFNDLFLSALRRRGRIHEAGLMASYKLRTGRLLEDVDKLPLMLRKGKLALLPRTVRGSEERKRIFEQAEGEKGARR